MAYRGPWDVAPDQRATNGGKIPIRKIYVNAVQNYPILQSTVIENFKKVGLEQIKSVQLSKTRVYFFVMFFTPEAAAEALSKRNQLRGKYGYKVRAADQWHQPLELDDGTIIWNRSHMEGENEEQENINTSASIDESKPSLLNLNDDVLLLVLEKLTLRECIGVERVCKRMRSLCQMRWAKVTCLGTRELVEFVKAGSMLPVDHFREILLRCGANLHTLDLSIFAEKFNLMRCGPQMIKYCPNLKKLNLPRLYSVNLQHISPLLSRITSFDVRDAWVDSTILDSILTMCTNLEELEFTCSGGATSILTVLEMCPRPLIKKLTADELIIPFPTVAKAFPNIRELRCREISYNKSRDDDLPDLSLTGLELNCTKNCPAEVIRKCPNLRCLHVFSNGLTAGSSFIESIVKLKSLKSLAMSHVIFNDEDFFTTIIERRWMGELEILSCHACELSSSSIFKIYDGNPGIKTISVDRIEVESFLKELNDKHRLRMETTNAKKLNLILFDKYAEFYWPDDDRVIRVQMKEHDECDVCDHQGSESDDDYDLDDLNDLEFDEMSDDLDLDDDEVLMQILARQGIFDDEDYDRPDWVDFYDEY